MKKLTVVVSILLMVNMLFAGGLKTNTNHSAAFIRTLNRNATLMVDGAYFNPAGLTKMSDGFAIGISNQSIFQTRTITSNFPLLNVGTYEGTTDALVFPNINLAYKMGKLAFSAAIMPIGGGGSAVYPTGLPSFETTIASLTAPVLAGGLGVDAYSVDIEFEGSSLFFGMQVSAAYEINDMISVSIGARYVTANNTYNGSIKNILISPTSGDDFITAGTYMTNNAALATGAAATYTALAAAESDPTLKATYEATAAAYTIAAATYTATAAGLDILTADIAVDAAQSGSGFAPIIGINLSPMDNLNIGIRYEMLTPLVMTNKTVVDGSGLFTDGAETHQDMPAMLAVGAAYSVSDALSAELSFNYYMNTGANWDGAEALTDNGYEAGLGIEYKISDALVASFGFLTSTGGTTTAYQSDLGFALDSNTIGLGIGYSLSENMLINIGFANTMYTDGANTAGTETYAKTSMDFAIGTQISF